MKRRVMIVILLSIVLVGCQHDDLTNQAVKQTTRDGDIVQKESIDLNEADVFYYNKEKGLIITENAGFTFVKEEQTTITFEKDRLKVILSVLSNEDSLSDIKTALKQSAGNITVLDETETFLSFQTVRNEPMRFDIYLTETTAHTYLTTFIAKAEYFDQQQPDMTAFNDALIFDGL